MALAKHVEQLEKDKFVEQDGDTAVRTTIAGIPSISITGDVSTVEGENAALTLGYTDGVLTSITKTVGSYVYYKTLSYDDDGNLTGVSSWDRTGSPSISPSLSASISPSISPSASLSPSISPSLSPSEE